MRVVLLGGLNMDKKETTCKADLHCYPCSNKSLPDPIEVGIAMSLIFM